MEDRKINEQESLEIITTMIERTKQRYMLGDGNILLMWGYLAVITCILVWLAVAITHNPIFNWLWFLMAIIGGIATPIMARRKKTKEGMKSYSDRIVSQIWTIVGICGGASAIACLGFSLIGGVHTWSMMFAYSLIIVPMAEITQGFIIREKSFVAGGVIGILTGIIFICCIAGQIPLYASWCMPMFIIAFICMMIIPGHVLNHKAKTIQ